MIEENEGLGASAADATDRVGGLRPEPTASSQPSGRSPTGAAIGIAEAAQIARVYGYFVTTGNDGGVFIQRTRNGDSVALIRANPIGEILPYADDYGAQDHLVATALSLAIAPPKTAASKALGKAA
jgi:hypothetical protein